MTETRYDEVGRAEFTSAPFAPSGPPDGVLWSGPLNAMLAVNQTIYDNASRPTDTILLGRHINGDDSVILTEKWRTHTDYTGDTVRVTPPSGGVSTTTVSDAQGRTTELRQHTTTDGVNGPYQATSYTYNRKDQLVAITDPDNNEWIYTYDVKGRQTQANDPDKGITVSTYNDYNDLTETRAANGKAISYTYDKLGRKTHQYDNSNPATPKLAARWKYDKVDIRFGGQTVRGQTTEATRYEPAGSTNAYQQLFTNFTVRNQPGGVTYIIPAAETGLNASWSLGYGYSEFDGSPISVKYPTAGALDSEEVIT
ncbi:hypothetical protein AAH979_18420 [Plantactinospora sp. ZYX-F-223]|uniref:hypothetical protein n=1 Tax=Plantactinospora sp. ZYX-F-223 TaxID=3144103 RepID=UPI0031FCB6C4